jgi:hypothetical protein
MNSHTHYRCTWQRPNTTLALRRNGDLLAGEGRLFKPTKPTSAANIEQALAAAKSAADMKTAYTAAYHLVQELIHREGENKVWKRLADRSYSVNITGS